MNDEILVRLHPSGVGTMTRPEGVEEYPAYPLINLWALCANPPIEEVRDMALRDAFRDTLSIFEHWINTQAKGEISNASK